MFESYRSAGYLLRAPHSVARCHGLVDFDGTIAPNDPTDCLLERFGDPSWRDIEADWQAGRFSSRECMGKQAELLRASPEELDAAIRSIEIDPKVPDFLSFCKRQHIDVTVVSDGFDRVVRSVLERAQISVPFFANKLIWRGRDRWSLAFPHARINCRSDSANCKCSHRASGARCIVIGDGRSDYCMSLEADYVIAKGALTHFCRNRGLPHATFDSFEDVTDRLVEWLESSGNLRTESPFTADERFDERPLTTPAEG